MSQVLDRVFKAGFGLAVAAALTFGSVQALSGAMDEHCPNDGQGMLGSCATQQECEDKCEDAHPGQDPIAVRDDENCCHCLL